MTTSFQNTATYQKLWGGVPSTPKPPPPTLFQVGVWICVYVRGLRLIISYKNLRRKHSKPGQYYTQYVGRLVLKNPVYSRILRNEENCKRLIDGENFRIETSPPGHRYFLLFYLKRPFFAIFLLFLKWEKVFLIKRYIKTTKSGKRRRKSLMYPGCLRLSFQLVNYHFTADTVEKRLRLTWFCYKPSCFLMSIMLTSVLPGFCF